MDVIRLRWTKLVVIAQQRLVDPPFWNARSGAIQVPTFFIQVLCARIRVMDFEAAISTMNKLLTEKQPQMFNRAWVRINAPCVYRFIQKAVRIENGGIDWDRVTRALSPKYQKQWTGSFRKNTTPYYNRTEIDILLRQYSSKLYTFIATLNTDDELIRDIISISFVRVAQKGNIAAKQEIIKLLSHTVEDWIERNPKLSCWRGYDQLIQTRLDCCIRRYRYSGSFMRYVYKTLEYAARGLKPLIAYSLDDTTHFKNRR